MAAVFLDPRRRIPLPLVPDVTTSNSMTEPPADGPAPLTAADGGADGHTAIRAAALAIVPRLLLALAGACALSGAVGMTAMLLGYGAPHLLVLLAPPAVVLLAAPTVLLRAWRSEER